jgi:putative tryptophan/tyrosine transport system substrate-binding protein
MRRREFIALIGGMAAARPHAARAQQTKSYRIGLLDYTPAEAGRVRLWQAFRQQLRELGYAEGQNVAFEPRWADNYADRLPGLAAELVNLNVDVIVTASSHSAVAAQRATAAIPIVMATGGDPLALGVVAALAHPGRNVTGVTTLTRELSAKRLELLREMIREGSRFGILWDLAHPAAPLAVRQVQAAGQRLGIAVEDIGVQRPEEFDGALSAMVRQGVVGVIVQSSALFFSDRSHLAELSTHNRLAMIAAVRDFAEAGCLVSYGPDLAAGFRRAADFVDKILKGAKPADLPIEQPTKFELVVNLRTAKAIGLTIPEAFLLRADEVIE